MGLNKDYTPQDLEDSKEATHEVIRKCESFFVMALYNNGVGYLGCVKPEVLQLMMVDVMETAPEIKTVIENALKEIEKNRSAKMN